MRSGRFSAQGSWVFDSHEDNLIEIANVFIMAFLDDRLAEDLCYIP